MKSDFDITSCYSKQPRTGAVLWYSFPSDQRWISFWMLHTSLPVLWEGYRYCERISQRWRRAKLTACFARIAAINRAPTTSSLQDLTPPVTWACTTLSRHTTLSHHTTSNNHMCEDVLTVIAAIFTV